MTSYLNRVIPEAHKIINGDRLRDYGHASINFERIAAGWRVIFADGKFTPRRTALAMVWVKICRDVEAPTLDNAIDMAGYAALMDEVEPVNPTPPAVELNINFTDIPKFDKVELKMKSMYAEPETEWHKAPVERCEQSGPHPDHFHRPYGSPLEMRDWAYCKGR